MTDQPQEWWFRSKDPAKVNAAIAQCQGRNDYGTITHGTCEENQACRRGNCFGPFKREWRVVVFKRGRRSWIEEFEVAARRGDRGVIIEDNVETYLADRDEVEIARLILLGGSACEHVVEADDLPAALKVAVSRHHDCIQRDIHGPRKALYLQEIRRLNHLGPPSDRCIVCRGKLRSRRSQANHVGPSCAKRFDLPYD